MNCNYPTTMYEVLWPKYMYFWYYLQFLLFTMKKMFKPKLQKNIFLPDMYIWTKILSYIVVREHVNVFLKNSSNMPQ